MTKKRPSAIYSRKCIHVSGILFDSVLERRFYDHLLNNGIDSHHIEVHKSYRIPGTTTVYTPDFVISHNDHMFYVDTKSPRTVSQIFKYKIKVLLQASGIRVDVVFADDFDLYIEYMNQPYKEFIGFSQWKKRHSKMKQNRY